MYINLVPVSGIQLSTILLGDELDNFLLIGGALVFLGLYLINRRQTFPSSAQFTSPS